MFGYVVVLALSILALVVPQPVAAQNLPAPPATFVDTTYTVPVGGQVIAVGAGGDLQAALDGAQPGDIIELAAGETFTGNFVLPNKTGDGWIHVRSSALASLPAPGTRVKPTDAAFMPKIVSPNTMPALTAELGAHHYRLVGVEITATLATLDLTLQNLVLFGYDINGVPATSLDQLPHDIAFDRCYVHGTPTGNTLRGLALNSATTAVIDSYLSNFHHIGSDSQAIAIWNGAGPFAIVNNRLEGSGENVLFGGAPPTIVNLVPSDIEIRHNHFVKPLFWNPADPSFAGIAWAVKNLLEFKNVQRVVVDGNVFEHVWPSAQAGFAILFTVRNEEGAVPWAVVQDIAFTRNVIRNAEGGVNIGGRDDNFPSGQTARILVRDNVFVDIGDRLFQIIKDAADITIDHNTGFQVGPVVSADEEPTSNFVYTNNLTPEGFGVVGAGTERGTETLNTYFPGFVFRRNVQVGGLAELYPPDNFFPPTIDDVGFVDFAGGDYTLSPVSPFKNGGTDGKDIGADIAAIASATAGADDGTPSTPPPPPPIASLTIVQPINGASVSDTVTVTAVATGSGLATVTFTLDGDPIGPTFTAPPYSFALDTLLVPNGPHTIHVLGYNAAAQIIAADSIGIIVANPLPTVRIATPRDGATVKGDVDVRAAVTRRRSVATLQFQLNGQNLGAPLTDPPYHVSWSTTGNPNGSYTVRAIVTTLAGETVTSDEITVVVANPVPSVRITKPKAGATVRREVRVEAVVAHVTDLEGLQFQLDGQDLGPALTKPPFAVSWNTRLVLNGPHTLGAVVTRTGGATLVADPVTVIVDNPLPTVRITKPVAGSTVKGQIDLRAAVTHRHNVASLQFQVDGANLGPVLSGPESAVPWNTLAVSDGPHTIQAMVVTPAGVTVMSDPVTVFVFNPLPTVRITRPLAGETVNGKVPVKAAVTERQRILTLQFQLDGQDLGPALITGDFTVVWDTGTASSGPHTLTAVITITAGAPITSAPVTVNVPKKR